ncbi:MAG: glycoside hydrolase [Parcubacteria group bacterium Licking1014_17]|nr:MAG: glycoside hydrolase [Parcubacteria group bacterium Licking1014_17]
MNKYFLVLLIMALLIKTNNVNAATGTIDSSDKYAWSENLGWVNFGALQGSVIISDSDMSGYAWSENGGWVSLNCSNTDSCATVNYGVKNTVVGSLSGYAWGENIGWINFQPTAGGVTINKDGYFEGYAWGENIGWVNFNCSNQNSCGAVDFKVKTSWRPGVLGGQGPTPTPIPTTNGPGGPVVTANPTISSSPTTTPAVSFGPTVLPVVTPTPSASVLQPPMNSGLPTTPPSTSVGPSSPPSGSIPPGAPPGIDINTVMPEKVVSVSEKVSTTTTLLFSASTAASALSLLSPGSSITGFLAYLLDNFLILFGIRKRRGHWGIVYNSVTKEPLPFIRVQVISKDMRVLESRVTDRQGRYGFLVSPETIMGSFLECKLNVEGKDFVFPSAKTPDNSDQILYQNIYHGEMVKIEPGKPVMFDIPIDPVGEAKKKIWSVSNMKLSRGMIILADVAFWVSLVILPLIFIIHPTWPNFLVLAVFALVNLFRFVGEIRERSFGVIKDRESKRPLPYALVMLDDMMGLRKNFAISDSMGRYFLLSDKGEYTISAVTPADVMPQRSVNVPITAKRGWIARIFDL